MLAKMEEAKVPAASKPGSLSEDPDYGHAVKPMVRNPSGNLSRFSADSDESEDERSDVIVPISALALAREDSGIGQDSCSVCYQIMVEPCDLKPFCGHKFCIQCVQKFLQINRSCPYCRTSIPQSFEPVVDVAVQQRLKALFPREYLARENELADLGVLVGDQVQVEFEIGNHYRRLAQPRASAESGKMVEHIVSPFVRFKNPAFGPLVNTFINDVEFKLCKCPNPNCENTITKKPKCNNCEGCLQRNGGWVEPDYEVSCALECWDTMKGMPVLIYFRGDLSTSPKEMCDCCDKLKKSCYLQYQ